MDLIETVDAQREAIESLEGTVAQLQRELAAQRAILESFERTTDSSAERPESAPDHLALRDGRTDRRHLMATAGVAAAGAVLGTTVVALGQSSRAAASTGEGIEIGPQDLGNGPLLVARSEIATGSIYWGTWINDQGGIRTNAQIGAIGKFNAEPPDIDPGFMPVTNYMICGYNDLDSDNPTFVSFTPGEPPTYQQSHFKFVDGDDTDGALVLSIQHDGTLAWGATQDAILTRNHAGTLRIGDGTADAGLVLARGRVTNHNRLIFADEVSQKWQVYQVPGDDGLYVGDMAHESERVVIGLTGGEYGDAVMTVSDRLAVTAGSGQIANLLELQNSSGTPLVAVEVDGTIRLGSATGPKVLAGSGSPNGEVTAPVGSLYVDTEGGIGTTLYVKEANTDDTGWAASASSSGGVFTPLATPKRVYDSRPGELPATGPKTPLVPATPRTIDLQANESGVPAGATSVLINLVATRTQSSSAGYLSVYRDDIPFPGTSNLNWSFTNQSIAVTTLTAVDAQARCALYAGSATDVVIDVLGYYQ
jgi:hypothetical protein